MAVFVSYDDKEPKSGAAFYAVASYMALRPCMPRHFPNVDIHLI